MHHLKFAAVDLEYGKYRDPSKLEDAPPPPKKEDMRDTRFDKFHRLPVVVIKGPLKGRKGRVISVNNHRHAQVELDSRMVYMNGPVSLHIEEMQYELYVLSHIFFLIYYAEWTTGQIARVFTLGNKC